MSYAIATNWQGDEVITRVTWAENEPDLEIAGEPLVRDLRE